MTAGQLIARQCATNAAQRTSSSGCSVTLPFESRMITPLLVRPTSTQFFFGVQWLDRSQRSVVVSRTSAAMAVPPNDAVTLE